MGETFSLLPDESRRAAARRLDALCDRFKTAWAAGRRPRIEEELADTPASERPTLLHGLLTLELEVRHSRGEQPTLQEYQERFPGYIAPVEEVFAGVTIPHGRYEILGVLGSGGMGIVFKARQRSLNRLVALKMIRTGIQDDPNLLARFRIEAETVARLDHPHIVQIHELGEFEGSPFLSLELLEGGA